MAYVNVAEWSPEHVSDWLRGLDDEVQPYTQFFVNNSINGCHLLTLCRDDLANLNIFKIGHQELVLEAVDLLKQLHYNLTSETLQSLALKLGCKAQSLFNQLKHVCKGEENESKKERVSTETLSAVSDILNLVKSLISWLDRYPFLGQEKYVNVRKAVLKLSVELASTAQRDQFAEMPHKVIKEICSNLSKQSDKIVQEFNDSLIIQPAVLEVAKIKRKPDDDVGIHINSSCTGIHVIESIKFQSPAYRCGKVEDGDEIVQVNYQTVVGWQVKNIICAMKEHPSEVHLTLKKRPRHPNVLGQVITLWPYRIPSKKTALRKLYKWNKGKTAVDINDICPKSPDSRCDINSVPENTNIPVNDKERQIFFGRSRSRIRRRATVTGISPTALQPFINLDDFIGNNSKKKQSVGRAVSYDPGKVGNVDDSVFKDDALDQEFVPKTNDATKSEDKPKKEKELTTQKSQFLQPPTEKYLGGCLRRQQQVTEISPSSEVSDIKLMVDFAKADTDAKQPSCDSQKSAPPKKDPSAAENPKPKFDWLQKQKAKLEGVTNGSAKPNQKTRSGSTASCPGIETTQSSVKGHSNTTLLPSRENRPSLSEMRALKRATESKQPNERIEPHPRKNVPSLPRQNILLKRNAQPQQQTKFGGSSIQHCNAKENELNRRLNGMLPANGKPSMLKQEQHYRNQDSLKYSVIPQYPYEMHESKIVSLKHRKGGLNYTVHPKSKISYVSEPPQKGAVNGLSARMHLPQKPPQSRTIKSAHVGREPQSFNPMFGRSRSYNDIAFSSDSSSFDEDGEEEEEEEDEVYEEVAEGRFANHQFLPPKAQTLNPNFAAKVAEAYYMLNQGHCFPTPPTGLPSRQFDPASSAFIDELAKRMYQALQLDHLKMQNYSHPRNGQFVPAQRNGRSKSLSREFTPPADRFGRTVLRDESCRTLPPQNFENRQMYNCNYAHPIMMKSHNANEIVHEKPVNLSPSTYMSSKQSIPAFKSATSQEIHNLYTSQPANKSPNNSYSHCGYDKQEFSGAFLKSEQQENMPIYESLSYFQGGDAHLMHYTPVAGNVRIGQGNQSIMFCPAERESESIQCNDKVISTPSDGWKYFDKGMFQPIKEETCVDDDDDIKEHVSIPNMPVCDEKESSAKIPQNIENNVTIEPASHKATKKKEEQPVTNKPSYKDVPPSITSLINSMPKPPKDDCCLKVRKCSDAQTETEDCSDSTSLKENAVPLNLGNDDSFSTQNSDMEIVNFMRSSSLSSSSSSSTISSSNSSYRYADSPNHSQTTIKTSFISSENCNDNSVDSLRSPTLPTMGVSMLSKKRPSNSGGSDSGCNSEPHNLSLEDISTATGMDTWDFPHSGIITDVEHTI